MKKVIVLLIWCLPLILYAQQKGIQWTESLSWTEVLAKAKSENKYIFLDCFATWCGPCHEMDKDVYPNEEVGRIVNENFISVKVQMDKTNYDNERVKKWYSDAKRIAGNYTVTSFPTFLFFNPDGTPMHRAVGYRGPEEFITLTKDAMNPGKQYYALLKSYQPGKFDTSELKGLARGMKRTGGELAAKLAIEYLSKIPKSELNSEDNVNLMCEFRTDTQMQEFAQGHLSKVPGNKISSTNNLTLFRNFSSVKSISAIALRYLSNLNMSEIHKNLSLLSILKKEAQAKLIADRYINSLKPEKIFTKETLLFLADFTKSSKDKGFEIFNKYPTRVDKTVQVEEYALTKVMNVIIEEEYDRYYTQAVKDGNDNIPWQTIFKKVKQQYGNAIAERLDIHVKASLYKYFADKQNKYWPEYISYYIQKVEKYGTDTSGPQHQFNDVMQLNNFVYDAIFFHSNDTSQMNTGLKWMEGVIRRNPRQANNIDTYANLLYKSGRIKEAIQWQERAVQIALEDKTDWVLPSLQANLVKMKKGEPTWSVAASN